MKIMVTGANGGYGHYAIQYLKEFAPAGTELYGLVRDDKKAQQLMKQGITPRIGDYSNVASLVEAFKGIDRLL